MYNHILDTFTIVADCGSFTKAAEHLYISPTAVMKQMNTLESGYNMKLLERTPSGVHLTPAGNAVYKGVKKLKTVSDGILKEAHEAAHTYDTTFCVGTSLLNPSKPFMDIWYKVNKEFPGYNVHLIPFEDNHEGIISEIENLGRKFDFLVGVCDSKAWLSLCSFLPIGRYKKMVAVPRSHRLASKDIIEIEELYGETLMMVKKGDSEVNDRLRHDLEKNHPQIKIEDTPRFYDLSVFNRCDETGNVLLTVQCWRDVHPGLVSIPVNWDYDIPYGILYSLNPPEDVLRFAETVKKQVF